MEKRDNLTIPDAVYLYNEGVKGVDFSARGGSATNSVKPGGGGKALKRFIKKNFGKIVIKLIKPREKIVATKGLLFDPIKTEKAFEKMTVLHPRGVKRFKSACRIILTDKVFATYDDDKRPHIRAAIYGFPSVISTSGIVEGPAKPKDYYIYKDRFTKLGVWPIEESKVKKKFKFRFIDYGDKRINEVLKGYISQAIFFHITGDPFCPKKKCRLFNAHWQEDLIYAQIKIGKFCPSHKKAIKAIRIGTTPK